MTGRMTAATRFVSLAAIVVVLLVLALTMSTPGDARPSVADDVASQGGAGVTPGRGTSTDPATTGQPGELPKREAERVLHTFLEASERLLASPAPDPEELDGVATGSARAELEATAAWFAAEDLEQRGDVEILAIDVGEEQDGVVPAEVCLDDRAVTLLRAGDPVLVEERPPGGTRHIYEFVHEDGGWLVSYHGFGDDPSC